VVHAYNLSTQEAGGFQVQGQPELYSKTFTKEKNDMLKKRVLKDEIGAK
jgi:hypothetical protein